MAHGLKPFTLLLVLGGLPLQFAALGIEACQFSLHA